MGLTVSFVLSPVTGLVCHRRCADHSANLTPASGRQDHTTSPSALAPFVSSPFDRSQAVLRPALPSRREPNAAASTASHPASVTIAIRPSVGRDGGSSRSDLGQTETEIFFKMRLDRANHFDRSTEISLRVMTRGRAGLHAVACDDTDPTSQTGTPRPFRSSAGTPGARACATATC